MQRTHFDVDGNDLFTEHDGGGSETQDWEHALAETPDIVYAMMREQQEAADARRRHLTVAAFRRLRSAQRALAKQRAAHMQLRRRAS